MSDPKAEMIEGYCDGLHDTRDALTPGGNFPHSEAYVHGWLNGRDDRLSQPRATAAELRKIAAEILSPVLAQGGAGR